MALALGACLLVAVLAASCGEAGGASAPPGSFAEIVVVDKMSLDPTGAAPLSAVLEMETAEEVTLEVRVAGRNGSDSDVVYEAGQPATEFEVPVLGLYPDFINTVHVTLFDQDGAEVATKTYGILTDPLSADFPEIEIEVAGGSQMADGFTLVSYWGYGVGREATPKRPFMFDRFGDVRWYLDLADDPVLGKMHYDGGIERLQNGNLYFGDVGTSRIYEVSMLGEVVGSWEMPGWGFHHQVVEKPNGNFLVTVNKLGEWTIEDHIIEIDRRSGTVVNIWDLRWSLDQERVALTDNVADWIHLNAVVFDERDDTIIVSGKNQGVVKLTEENEVVWILGPHRGWGSSGAGVELSQFLLQPLNDEGEPIQDQAVLDGAANDASFEWNWQQHAPLIMANGDLMLFDNGKDRNYGGVGPYSRAVEYDIDEEAMTVQQVWSYGSERGAETYSGRVSDVDYLASADSVIWSSGSIDYGSDRYGKVIEVEYFGRQVIFEATIRAPVAGFGNIVFHRAERLPIYPED